MESRQNILAQIKKKVLAVDPAADVFLFGSQVRKDAHPESDWDVLILTDKKKATLDYKAEFYRRLFEIELKNGIVIGPLVRNRDDWNALYQTGFYKNVNAERQLL